MADRDSDFSNSGSYPPSSGNFPSGNFLSGNFPSSNFSQDDYQRRMEELDERLSCAVCLSRFTEPRLLSCNHTFCKHCLEDVLAKRAMDVDHPLGDYEIACPRCREVTRLGHGGIETLPKNYDLELVVDAMPPEPPDSKVFARQQSVPTCQQHCKELAYYCKTDNTLVCADCLVDPTHKHHDTYRAGDVGKEEREEFEVGCFELLEKQRQNFMIALHEVSHATNSLKQKGEQTKENIQRHFQSLRESLAQREDDLLRETERIITQKVTRLMEQEKQLKQMHEELDLEYEHCKRLMESSPVDFLHNKHKLVGNIKAVVDRASQVQRTPVEIASQGPYWHHPSTSLVDTETKSGVFCEPVSSMYTIAGSGLAKAFIGKEATFKVEARDKYGNRSFMKGTNPNVTILGPNKSNEVSYIIDESVAGEYIVRYTPSNVGWHTILVTVNEESIKNGEHKVIVFGSKDYLGMAVPLKSMHKSQVRFEPSVSTMRGVCTLPNGWIAFVDASCIRVIDGFSGKALQTIGIYGKEPGQFSTPVGITVTPQNHIFVTDTSNHRVQRFSLEGKRFRYASFFGTQGTNKQSLQYPEGITSLGDDRVFIADKGNNRVLVISQRSMRHQNTIGKKGERPGQFNGPRDVAVSSSFLLVSDTGNKRIQALTFEGKILTVFGGYNSVLFQTPPSFIIVDKDGFILIIMHQAITILTPSGEFARQFNSKYLKTPYGICVDSQGDVVITDSTTCRILCF